MIYPKYNCITFDGIRLVLVPFLPMSIKHKMSKQETELVSEKNNEWFSAEIANIRRNYIFYLSLERFIKIGLISYLGIIVTNLFFYDI